MINLSFMFYFMAHIYIYIYIYIGSLSSLTKNKSHDRHVHLRVQPARSVRCGQGLIDTSYKMFDATQCESNGLIPNWAKVYEETCLVAVNERDVRMMKRWVLIWDLCLGWTYRFMVLGGFNHKTYGLTMENLGGSTIKHGIWLGFNYQTWAGWWFGTFFSIKYGIILPID